MLTPVDVTIVPPGIVSVVVVPPVVSQVSPTTAQESTSTEFPLMVVSTTVQGMAIA